MDSCLEKALGMLRGGVAFNSIEWILEIENNDGEVWYLELSFNSIEWIPLTGSSNRAIASS